MLVDNHNRKVNYLRIAVTDRCNLRCFYCMPAEGIKYVPKNDLLTYEEMLRLVGLMANMGISKVRITGGEPFVRRGIMDFMTNLSKIKGIEQINLTTNGLLTAPFIPQLLDMGIHSVNLSLDTVDEERFFKITRRKGLKKVLKTLELLVENKVKTKINCVVMEGQNTDDLLPMTLLAKDNDISVRFLEEMPFNGTGQRLQGFTWNHQHILAQLQEHFPTLYKVPDPPHSTSLNYQIPDFKGSIGIIPSFSRTFCGTCNRIRLTPQGMIKTCLYDAGVFNVKDLMRENLSDDTVKERILQAIGRRAKNGFEAEENRGAVSESMSTIGG